MKITSIELTGQRISAVVSRNSNCDFIQVEILRGSGLSKNAEIPHYIDSKNLEDLWLMSLILQKALDGRPGTDEDIKVFFDILQLLN